jgi:hypothetical protein
LLLAAAMPLLGLGCLARASVGTRATIATDAYVETEDPSLVEVRPGVWVVEDYDEPIFFEGGYYWAYRGNAWYRSSMYTGGWVVATPPRVILDVPSPHLYVRFRGDVGARVRRGPHGAVVVRHHPEAYRRTNYRRPAPPRRVYPPARYDRDRDRTRYDRTRYDRTRYDRNTHDRARERAERDRARADRDRARAQRDHHRAVRDRDRSRRERERANDNRRRNDRRRDRWR